MLKLNGVVLLNIAETRTSENQSSTVSVKTVVPEIYLVMFN